MGLETIALAVGAVGALTSAGVSVAGALQKDPKAPGVTPVDTQARREEEQRKERIRRALARGQSSTVLTNPLGSTQPLGLSSTIPTLTGSNR